jgi:hypothetical protein
MGYVLVNKQSRTRHPHLPRKGGAYATEAAARAALTRYRGGRYDLGAGWEIMEERDYAAQVPMVEVTNLMTGKKVMERADTPWSCSVASESYWSS